MGYDRHTTITPAPVPRSSPATIGDALQAVDDHASWCEQGRKVEREQLLKEKADQHTAMWSAITALKLELVKMQTSMTFAAKVIALAVTLFGAGTTIGIFVARYAIVGAVVTEIDKRMPPIGTKAAVPTPVVDHYASGPRP
jgi:hypothetical protein